MSALEIVKDELHSMNIPYEFMRWSGTVRYPYWVGEYSEVPTITEDGAKENTMLLTGTTNGSWLELEKAREKIERHFPSTYGLRKSVDEGAVVIYYENAFPVPTGEADLKRLQINLRIKEWKGVI